MTTTVDSEPVQLRVVEHPSAQLRLVDPPPRQATAELVDTYARQVDELAALVEAEAVRVGRVYRTLADSLGELHGALDELRARLGREVGRR